MVIYFPYSFFVYTQLLDEFKMIKNIDYLKELCINDVKYIEIFSYI